MPSNRTLIAAVTSVTALMLAGCGGDDGGSTAEEGESPLAEYMGETAAAVQGAGAGMAFGGGGGEPYEPTEEELQQQREYEEVVASCMAEQGFEYVPNVVTPDEYTSPFEEAYSLPPDEFAAEYGYGVSTLRVEEADLPEDPNQEIRESLSPEAREAYEEALTGDLSGPVEVEEGEEPTPPSIEDRGCFGQASAEVFGVDESQMFGPRSEFQGLMQDLSRLAQRVQNDPRVAEATEQWQQCMADAGYPDFERVDGPRQSVFQRMAELQGIGGPPTEAPPEGGAEGEEGSESAGAVVMDPQEIDPADLEELQEYELAVANADFDCREEHYTDIAEEVRYELEEEFVEEHRAELEQYRDEMAQLPGGSGEDEGESDD